MVGGGDSAGNSAIPRSRTVTPKNSESAESEPAADSAADAARAYRRYYPAGTVTAVR